MAFGKKGAATLSDYGSYSSGERTTAYDARYDASSPGVDHAYRIKADWKDGLLGVAIGGIGALMTSIAAPDVQYENDAMITMLVGGLCILGGLVMIMMAATGKDKLIVDETGLHQSTLFGKTTVGWSDLDKFEVWTVNFNKMIYAQSTERTAMIAKKKVTVPTKAFKSKNFELAAMVVKHRPDLFDYIPAVMKSVGAKKLIPSLEETFS